jgi:heptosyltransferase-2
VKLAIIKPDHLGDLVLSSPAIRAMGAQYPDTTLFVASRSLALARALFPRITLRPLDFPHLAKHADGLQTAIDFRAFDAVAILRRDGIISPGWASLRMERFVMYEDSHGVHQTILDYGVAREFVPPYEIDALFHGERADGIAAKAAADPLKVGLSIGSGFYANTWPLVHWIELGRALRRQGREVTIVHGPADTAQAAILIDSIKGARALAGGSDFGAFFDQVGELDLVVASDGGTAHLCSVAAPILSIFGPSPVRRYAPIGSWNRALTQLLSCSPCCQYAERLVNGCLSVECMAGITPGDVLSAMTDRVRPDQVGKDTHPRPGLTLVKGPSATQRAEALEAREYEMRLWNAGAKA